MALKINLINMPFADVCLPSIALTQLKATAEQAHGSKISIRIVYLNHEFARFFGPTMYDFLSKSSQGHVSGLGEWLFRGVAFPELPDNTSAYFTRYAHLIDRSSKREFESRMEPLRSKLSEFLDSLIVRYRIHEADVVGMTSMFFQNLPSIALAQRLRQISDRQTIVMGGANCEGTMGIEIAANVPIIDYVFSGHALISFPKFIGHVLDANTDECHRIDGVFSKENSRSAATLVEKVDDIDWSKLKPGSLLKGISALGQEQDINLTPELDYDTFFHSLSHLLPELQGKAHLGFETSRGCWWGERAHCTFCGLNGSTMAYRSMHPDRAVAFMEQLFKRYGNRTGYFDSVDNILPREYFEGVFSRLRVPDHISLFYEVKSDLNEDQVRLLANGHVRRIQPGIEALATSTLKLMRKGTTAFHGLQLLKYCKDYEVTPFWNLLVGFPGEASEVYETYIRVLPSLFHLPPPSGVFPVRFDRFSPYFTLEKEYDLKLAPYDYYALCYPFPAVALRNMAYYFQDHNTEARYASDLAKSVGEMQTLTDRWKASWSSTTGAPKLELGAGPEGPNITDSRDGKLHQYLIENEEIALLKSIGQPMREEELPENLKGVLDSVKNKRLVFSERGRVASLVSAP